MQHLHSFSTVVRTSASNHLVFFGGSNLKRNLFDRLLSLLYHYGALPDCLWAPVVFTLCAAISIASPRLPTSGASRNGEVIVERILQGIGDTPKSFATPRGIGSLLLWRIEI